MTSNHGSNVIDKELKNTSCIVISRLKNMQCHSKYVRIHYVLLVAHYILACVSTLGSYVCSTQNVLPVCSYVRITPKICMTQSIQYETHNFC